MDGFADVLHDDSALLRLLYLWQMEDVANNWALAVFRLLELLPKHPAIPHLQIGTAATTRSSRSSHRSKAMIDSQAASKEVNDSVADVLRLMSRASS